MIEKFGAGPEATLNVDEYERQRWESFGLTGREAQDKVFREMARAVADLTTVNDDVDWQSASGLLASNQTLRSTES